MKIYTKTGDKGQTSLYDGHRVPKNDIRVESYGTIDELNASIGVARQYCRDASVKEALFRIQRLLFNVAGMLATKDSSQFPEPITEDEVRWLEQTIDYYLDKMNRDEVFQFIIPGSNFFSASMHVSRTICRRAERRMLTLAEQEPIPEALMKFINRLSDTLYTIARYSETELNLVNFKK
ncbi:MAG: cob(I)alamin adenosyltransferase [Clostridiales bacterium]|jgi:cob(I)alamin adenosyltransferase|nr:cob(I)alamin adenosyltransferase [Clostridiales bacterium]MDN5297857.1 cob(I)alamin adenosyltransferase [Clostridiales bacterium]